jgi:quinol monooxygenase YgiN
MEKFLSLLLAGLTFASSPWPQARIEALPESAFHSVSYVEVVNSASARSAATMALRSYLSACKLQPGFLRLESFEQTGRPGHFVFIESWQDQSAFDRRAQEIQKQLSDALQPIRISDVDRRPYKTFNVAAAARPSRDALYVITHIDASPQPQLPSMLQRLAEDSRRDEGNLRFDILQHTQRANHYTIIEAWRDQKAADAHAAAPHTKQYREEFAPMAGSPLDERSFQAIAY